MIKVLNAQNIRPNVRDQPTYYVRSDLLKFINSVINNLQEDVFIRLWAL